MVEAGDQPPSAPSRRAPAGVAADLVATMASLLVFFFDALEAASGRLLVYGPVWILGVVGYFVATWFAAGSPILALAARPAREGLWAGGLVALAMLWFLLGHGTPAAEVPIRLFL